MLFFGESCIKRLVFFDTPFKFPWKGWVVSMSRASVLACHKSAGVALRGRKGICLSVFALFLLCLFSVCGVFSVCEGALRLLGWRKEPTFYLLFLLVGLLPCALFLAPLGEGIAVFFYRLSRSHHPKPSDMLSFFYDGKRYRYALLRFAGRLFRVSLFGSVFFAVACLGKRVAEYFILTGAEARAALVLGGTILFLLLLLGMGIRFSYRSYLMGAARFSVPTLSYRALRGISSVGMKHRYGKVILLDLSFLPLLVLSLFLLGIPLVFLIPRYLAARAEMCFSLLSIESS